MTGPVYTQRPSKDVTRQVFVDMLGRLDGAVSDIRRFQYVGFGALEFVDFDLIHRVLGISKMTSIENDPNLDRYQANKPYRCIEVLGGHATDMLTKVDWTQLSIVWLDYECPLNDSVLTDVEYLCSKMLPGSVLAVTLNAHPGTLTGRRDRLAENIGEGKVPQHFDDDRLGDWGWAEAQQKVLFSSIRRKLGKRIDAGIWWQALNIQYRDGAPMQLVAGVIATPVLEPALETCNVTSAPYFRPEAEALEIEVPYLTPHEQRLLRQKLPRGPRQRLPSLPGVVSQKVESYAKFYQWIAV